MFPRMVVGNDQNRIERIVNWINQYFESGVNVTLIEDGTKIEGTLVEIESIVKLKVGSHVTKIGAVRFYRTVVAEVEEIDLGSKPNAAEWLMAGENGRTNLDRLAELFAKNGSLVPVKGSELEALIKKGKIETDDRFDLEVSFMAHEMIDQALVKYGTSVEFLTLSRS